MGHCLHFVALPLTFASCHFRIFAASPRKNGVYFSILFTVSREHPQAHTHAHKQTQANTHPSWPVSRLQHCGKQRRLCHDSYSLITKVNMGTSLIRHVCQQWQCLLRLLFYFLLIEFEFRRLRCTHILLKYCTHKERERERWREGWEREERRRQRRCRNRYSIIFIWWVPLPHFILQWPRVIANLANRAGRQAGSQTPAVACHQVGRDLFDLHCLGT